MDDKFLHKKQELLNWLISLEDEETINKLIDFKENTFSINNLVADSRAEYVIKDDFDERFARGIPHEEMKRRTIEYINSLPWKK